MVGFLAIFCILGASLASEVQKSDEGMLEVLIENKHYLDTCEDSLGFLGINFAACEAIVGDFVNIETFLNSSSQDIFMLVKDVEGVMAKFNQCSNGSIFERVSCYESLASEVSAVAKEAETDIPPLLSEMKVLLSHLETDVSECLGKTSSHKEVMKKVRLCKNSLMRKASRRV